MWKSCLRLLASNVAAMTQTRAVRLQVQRLNDGLVRLINYFSIMYVSFSFYVLSSRICMNETCMKIMFQV